MVFFTDLELRRSNFYDVIWHENLNGREGVSSRRKYVLLSLRLANSCLEIKKVHLHIWGWISKLNMFFSSKLERDVPTLDVYWKKAGAVVFWRYAAWNSAQRRKGKVWKVLWFAHSPLFYLLLKSRGKSVEKGEERKKRNFPDWLKRGIWPPASQPAFCLESCSTISFYILANFLRNFCCWTLLWDIHRRKRGWELFLAISFFVPWV